MKHKHLTQRAAFTMLELVFVITILGIVSSIGAEIIAQVYESYITQRASQRSSIKTEMAATQIANRLAYAIPNTVIGRISDTDATYIAIDELDTTNYQVLQWTAYDADSFGAITTASRRPGWSGFADLDAAGTTLNTLSTPGSQLAVTDTIIQNLSQGATKTLASAAVFFPGTYNAYTIGYGADSSGVSSVASGAGGTLTLAAPASGTRTIKEHYKLAWSSYAIVPINCGASGCDLALRYNFQPWIAGSTYSNAPSVILLRNVSVFKFTGSANTIRFKICQQENIGETFSITTCKEKAVIR